MAGRQRPRGEGGDDYSYSAKARAHPRTQPATADPSIHASMQVRMVDGSEYNVPVPEGVAPGGRFIAHFPVQDMQEVCTTC